MSQPLSLELRTATDDEIVEHWKAHGPDDAAAEEIFRRYRKRVYLWCHGYSHDVDEAVDLTQEVFIKVFGGLDGFRSGARLSTWIYTVARNHCLGRLTLQGEQWRRRLATLDGVDVPDQGVARLVRERDREGQLEVLLDRARQRMKEEELQAFVLHYRDGLAVGEITRILGCTNATGARTLIQNARRKFRRMTSGKEYPDV